MLRPPFPKNHVWRSMGVLALHKHANVTYKTTEEKKTEQKKSRSIIVTQHSAIRFMLICHKHNYVETKK